MTAPAASPSHHVSQSVPASDGGATPPSTRVATPTLALTRVATSPASTTKRTTPEGVSSRPSAPTKRQTSQAPNMASRVLPTAITAAGPTGSGENTLATNAPTR